MLHISLSTYQSPPEPDELYNKFEKFLKTSRYSTTTIAKYLTALKVFFHWLENTEQSLPSISLCTCRDFEKALIHEYHFSALTAKQKCAGISTFISFVLQENLIDKVNHSTNTRAIQTCLISPTKTLTPQQQRCLLEKIQAIGEERDLAIVQLILNTGLSPSEICMLTWKDIEIPLYGCAYLYVSEGPKKREIPLNDIACRSLYVLGYTKRLNSSSYVLSGQRGSMTRYGINQMLRKYTQVVGLGHITPLSLKYTFYENLALAGVDPKELAKIMGNKHTNKRLVYYNAKSEEQPFESAHFESTPNDQTKVLQYLANLLKYPSIF